MRIEPIHSWEGKTMETQYNDPNRLKKMVDSRDQGKILSYTDEYGRVRIGIVRTESWNRNYTTIWVGNCPVLVLSR